MFKRQPFSFVEKLSVNWIINVIKVYTSWYISRTNLTKMTFGKFDTLISIV